MPCFRPEILRLAIATWIVAVFLAPTAGAFSSGGGSCLGPAAGAAFHGPGLSGTGGFSFTATLDGVPVTQVEPGQTVRFTLSEAAGYKGFHLRVNEGDRLGPFISGLAVTDAFKQKIDPNCAPLGSVATQTFDGISLFRLSDAIDWTVPLELPPGTDVVVTAIPVVSISEWYGGFGEIQLTLTVVEPAAVPALGPWSGMVLVAAFAIGASMLRRQPKPAC